MGTDQMQDFVQQIFWDGLQWRQKTGRDVPLEAGGGWGIT